jgi:hypothetical protein
MALHAVERDAAGIPGAAQFVFNGLNLERVAGLFHSTKFDESTKHNVFTRW